MKLAKSIAYAGKAIESINAVGCSFGAMVAAMARPNTTGANGTAHLNRIRMELQTRMVDSEGGMHAVKYNDVPMLPVALGRALKAAVDSYAAEGEAKVLTEGNGVETPILMQLAKPLSMNSKIDGVVSITELEFRAANFGQIEAVLSAGTRLEQTMELIKKCSSAPQSPNLMPGFMPGVLIDQISLDDGLAIMINVLPKILDELDDDAGAGVDNETTAEDTTV